MAAGGILNANMAEVGQWLRGGIRWWLAELAGLLPERLRTRDDLLRLHAPAGGTAGWQAERRGRTVALAGGDAAAVIVAPSDAVLTRVVPMPALPAGDLHRMIALDLDRLAPLGPGEAVFDWRPNLRDRANDRFEVLVGIMRRREAERLRDAAEALGYRPQRLALQEPGGRLAFDFLRDLQGASPGQRAQRRWWLAVLLLFALNLAVLVGRDVIGTRRLETAVTAASPAADAAHALQDRIARERRQQALALRARDRHEPLGALSALTRVLPQGAWVQHLAWDGRTLRAAGYKDRGLDMLGALRREGRFRDVHESGSDAASQASAAQPYDVSAVVVPPR